MIEIEVPGRGMYRLHHLVLDVNGAVAVDGRLVEGVARRLAELRDSVEVSSGPPRRRPSLSSVIQPGEYSLLRPCHVSACIRLPTTSICR